jgi:CRP-like cAMP-binding protein
VIDSLGLEHVFPDRDEALEWAEDLVIARCAAPQPQEEQAEIPVERLALFADLSDVERLAVTRRLQRREYRGGEIVAREGDAGTELFIIVRGSATGRHRTRSGRDARLMSFAAGTIAGELGVLDEETRSATIVADEDLVCLVLGRDEFRDLMRDEPAIAVKLLFNLSREVSWRLRRANQRISDFD